MSAVVSLRDHRRIPLSVEQQVHALFPEMHQKFIHAYRHNPIVFDNFLTTGIERTTFKEPLLKAVRLLRDEIRFSYF